MARVPWPGGRVHVHTLRTCTCVPIRQAHGHRPTVVAPSAGFGARTRWRWRQTVGPAEARPGHFNAAWGYWVTDGLGLFEMLLLAEKLGAQPQVTVHSGYSLRGEYAPGAAAEVWSTRAT